MTIQIVVSSPKAIEFAEALEAKKEKYPFEKLEVGQSFTVPTNDANLQSLRTLASRKSKAGKRFVVVVHDEHSLVEVARRA